MRPALLLALLALLGLIPGSSQAVGPWVGGDDVLVTRAKILPEWTDLHMRADGSLYMVLDRDIWPTQSPLEVHRSLDGGWTWQLWATITEPAGQHFSLQESILAEGTTPRLHLIYNVFGAGVTDDVLRVSTTVVGGSSATWTTSTPFAQAGVRFVRGDLATDADQFSSYFLYAVAQGEDASGKGDIWFSRSNNSGASWSTPYKVCDVNGTGGWYKDPVIAVGQGGFVHLGFSFGDGIGVSSVEDGLRYVRAANWAGSAADWGSPLNLIPVNGDADWSVADLAASPAGPDVQLLTHRHPSVASSEDYLWNSRDAGISFPQGIRNIYNDSRYLSSVRWNQTGTRLWVAGRLEGASICDGSPMVMKGVGSPPALGPVQCHGPAVEDFTLTAASIAPDPIQEDRYGFLWGGAAPICDASQLPALQFDATWFTDPGVPNLEPGFPLALNAAPASPPALVQLDGDPDLEIVFQDVDGNVQVRDPDGSSRPGWPVDAGDFVLDSAVAIGDLNGDGKHQVVVGNTIGHVVSYAPDGSMSPGFPVELGTATAVRVCIAPVAPPYPKSIVATSGTQVFVVSWRGEILESWTTSNSIVHPAAVGVLTEEDVPLIVVVQNFRMLCFRPGQVAPEFDIDLNTATAFTVSTPPMLYDANLDSNREIAVGSIGGKVLLIDSQGNEVWRSVFGGSPIRGLAVAHNTVLDLPELYVTFANQVTSLRSDGSTKPGFPVTLGTGTLTAPALERIDPTGVAAVMPSSDLEAWAITKDGATITGWPKELDTTVSLSPAVGDLDGDGRSEIVVLTSTSLVVLDVNQTPEPNSMSHWRMWGKDPGRSFCQGSAFDPLATAVGPESTRFAFAPPQPNPARGSTHFHFRLETPGSVELSVYDLAGRRVRQLVRNSMSAGAHEVFFDGRDEHGQPVANGQYLARLQVRGGGSQWEQTRKVSLIR